MARRTTAPRRLLLVAAAVPIAIVACSSDDTGDGVATPLPGSAVTTAVAGAPITTVAGAPITTIASAPITTIAGAPVASPAAPPPPPPPTTTVTAPPTTQPVPPEPDASTLEGFALVAQPVAAIDKPTAMVTNPRDASMYITSQTGQVHRIVPGGQPSVVLDLSGVVSEWAFGSERGLLGITISPVDGRLFVYYTDLDVQAHIVSYALGPDGTPDPASAWNVIDIEQPGLGHKGGGLMFDEQGQLYLALGDGGGSRGRDAQDYTKILGGIIRIVPSTTGPGYTVPPDNPYVADPSRRPEIWAKGLRNPWGFWRDPANGDLWIGDVGESTIEELNRIPAGQAGANFGWYFIEGTDVRYDGAPADVVAPIFTYRHGEIGPAVIGGRAYRGTAIPALRGAYVFADMAGAVFAAGAGNQIARLDISLAGSIVTGFGEGPGGELWVLTLQEGVLQLVPG